MSREIVCPFCFEKVPVTSLGFYCENCRSGFPRNVLSRFLHFPNFTFKQKCPQCHQMTTSWQCPACKSELPPSIADAASDLTIAIIGAKETGKSHFITMLIEQIQKLYDQFDWALLRMNESTIHRYTEEFRKPIFEHLETIPPTQEGKREPLLFSLKFRHPRRSITLAFFDTAGEELDRSTQEMDRINRYIYNASGIICLLDPLQLSRVRNVLIPRIGVRALPQENTDASTMLTKVVHLIRHGFKCKNQPLYGRPIPIPLAVVFSKIDAMRTLENTPPIELFAADAPLFQPSRHQGIFSVSQFENIHEYLKAWLQEVDTFASIIQPCREFSTVGFFGLSALGCNPQETQKLKHEPRPWRVEDPFLWLLWQKKLIKGK